MPCKPTSSEFISGFVADGFCRKEFVPRAGSDVVNEQPIWFSHWRTRICLWELIATWISKTRKSYSGERFSLNSTRMVLHLMAQCKKRSLHF